MRLLFGFFGSALLSAIVAAVWILVSGGDQTIMRSFGVPDFVGAFSPGIAVSLRYLMTFQANSTPAVAAVFDVLFGLPVFIALDFGGLLLFSAVGGAWQGEDLWDRLRPIWGALTFAIAAAIVVLGSLKFGLPPFAQLRVQPIGLMLAATLGGCLYGFGRTMFASIEEH